MPQTFLWSPVVLRCGSWVIAETCVLAAALLNEMEKGGQRTSFYGWLIFACAIVGKAAMTIRLFLDQSYTQHAEKLEKANGPSTSGGVPAPGSP